MPKVLGIAPGNNFRVGFVDRFRAMPYDFNKSIDPFRIIQGVRFLTLKPNRFLNPQIPVNQKINVVKVRAFPIAFIEKHEVLIGSHTNENITVPSLGIFTVNGYLRPLHLSKFWIHSQFLKHYWRHGSVIILANDAAQRRQTGRGHN